MNRNLLPERNFHPGDGDISFYCNTPCINGTMVCVYSWPAGALLDDPGAEVGPPVGPLNQTVPAGIIVQGFVEFDNTRMTMDMSDFEMVMVGSKANFYKHGWCVPRTIAANAGSTAATQDQGAAAGKLAGKALYYDDQGFWTTIGQGQGAAGASGSVCVGTFQSERDANGFARIFLDVPTYGRKAGL